MLIIIIKKFKRIDKKEGIYWNNHKIFYNPAIITIFISIQSGRHFYIMMEMTSRLCEKLVDSFEFCSVIINISWIFGLAECHCALNQIFIPNIQCNKLKMAIFFLKFEIKRFRLKIGQIAGFVTKVGDNSYCLWNGRHLFLFAGWARQIKDDERNFPSKTKKLKKKSIKISQNATVFIFLNHIMQTRRKPRIIKMAKEKSTQTFAFTSFKQYCLSWQRKIKIYENYHCRRRSFSAAPLLFLISICVFLHSLFFCIFITMWIRLLTYRFVSHKNISQIH